MAIKPIITDMALMGLHNSTEADPDGSEWCAGRHSNLDRI